jgi:hypothetical protein
LPASADSTIGDTIKFKDSELNFGVGGVTINPDGTDKIDGINAGTTLENIGDSVEFVWSGIEGWQRTNSIYPPAGFAGSVSKSVSAAGATQGTATVLTSQTNIVDVVVSAADGVKLPAAVAGTRVYIKNDDLASPFETLNVYPFLGDFIDGAAVNVADTLAVGVGQWYVALDDADWISE